ncbi:hypothetical protein ACE41F_26695 [Bacillus cereus]|uniref:hypothetical protein n=1 Tax=Bacillus cereus TaxID=1396 RepID=UPI0035CBFEDE
MKFNFSYKPKTKLGRKIGEKLNGKSIFIGIPRYEKSIKWALGADLVFLALCIADAYGCVKTGKPILAAVSAFITAMYFLSRGIEVGGLVEKKAGAAE